jgi:hypothetical protein
MHIVLSAIQEISQNKFERDAEKHWLRAVPSETEKHMAPKGTRASRIAPKDGFLNNVFTPLHATCYYPRATGCAYGPRWEAH